VTLARAAIRPDLKQFCVNAIGNEDDELTHLEPLWAALDDAERRKWIEIVSRWSGSVRGLGHCDDAELRGGGFGERFVDIQETGNHALTDDRRFELSKLDGCWSEDDDAKETGRLVKYAGGKAVVVAGDIKSEDHCNGLVERAVADLGGIDIPVKRCVPADLCVDRR